MKTQSKVESITIIGRRWFRRGPGTTYHTAEIVLNGETVHKTPKQYGYGDQYADTAFRWLLSQGIIPPPEHPYESHWRHIRDNLGIPYSYRAIDVARERDL